jgi:hypothetical protein
MVRRTWPSVELILRLQPETDDVGKPRAGARTGWTAVRAWCEANASRLTDIIRPGIGEDLDLLIIALDADIAVAAGITDPPVRGTAYDTKRLCDTVKRWLLPRGRRALPPEVVIAIPAMSTEAWILAALFKDETRPEACRHPMERLAARKRLRRNVQGRPAKDLATYEKLADVVGVQLGRVRRRCKEAERLCAKIEARREFVEGKTTRIRPQSSVRSR